MTCNCVSCEGAIEFDGEFAPEFQSGDKEWGQEIKCPHCNAQTRVYRKYEPPLNPIRPPKPKPILVMTMREKIRESAKIRTGFGQAFLGLAIVSAVFSGIVYISQAESWHPNSDGYLVRSVSDEQLASTLIIGSSISSGLLCLSMFLFILGQIMHIRANTHRN
jgi:hypothetical protein